MTIEQVLEKIEIERTVGSRFPVRLIFVENLEQYMELTSHLNRICDLTLNLADEDICSGADIYPNFNKLIDKILKNNGKHILLLSMGEYLRFRIKRESVPSTAKFTSLWQLQQDAISKTRVFIPMFACRELFERIVPYIDDRQRDFIWEIETSTSLPFYSISVFSPIFSDTGVPNSIKGLRQWLARWEDEYAENRSINIITALHGNVERTNGQININIVAFLY